MVALTCILDQLLQYLTLVVDSTNKTRAIDERGQVYSTSPKLPHKQLAQKEIQRFGEIYVVQLHNLPRPFKFSLGDSRLPSPDS